MIRLFVLCYLTYFVGAIQGFSDYSVAAHAVIGFVLFLPICVFHKKVTAWISRESD